MVIITGIAKKIFSIMVAFFTFLNFQMPAKTVEIDHSTDVTNYPYVFVHGYFGWGWDCAIDEELPYWGLSTGDYTETFNKAGFTVSSATVSPTGSAWDRACELYAQLTGTVVDYGKAHSEKYGHDRYGADYTGKALVSKWDKINKINIICHSFGGPTCSMFASIMEYGAIDEIKATTDGSLSKFFIGGKGDYIYSITGVAGAYNGTTTCIIADKAEDFLNGKDEMAGDDGIYDMNPDNSVKMNETIKTVDSIYYFTVPCCTTYVAEDGTSKPDMKITDYQFAMTAVILGKFKTTTKGGIVIDESWLPNDGVVNTISESGPNNAPKNFVNTSPSLELVKTGFSKGIYNVMETYIGSHMSIMGNVSNPNPDGLNYLTNLMLMINAL